MAGNEKLPFTSDNAPQPGDIVFAADASKRIIYLNDEAEEVFGWPRARALGAPLESVCPMFRSGTPVDVAAIAGGRELAGGVDSRNRAGVPLALYVYGAPARTLDGKPAAAFIARDVSDFRRVEETARTSEEKYRLLFENITDSVAIADINGHVLEANPACAELYGYPAEELKGMNLADPVARESRAAAAGAMKELAAGRRFKGTLKMVRKDGTGFFADAVAHVVSVAGEQRILSVTRDVTERVLAEEATRASERKYRTVFETAGDGAFLETIDGIVLDVNGIACEMLGYTKEELVGKSVADLVPPEARPLLPRVTDAIMKRREFRGEAVNLRKDGTTVPVEIAAVMVDIDEGPLVLALVRDITERKAAEQALRYEKERAQQFLDVAGVMLVALDESGAIRMVNRKACEVLGRPEDELVGRSWFDTCLPEADRAKTREVHRLLVTGNGELADHHENPVLAAGGQERIIAWHNVLLQDRTGAITGTLSSGEDVTELRRAAKELGEFEKHLRALQDNVPVGLYRTSPAGRFLSVNRAFARMLGYESEAAVLAVSVASVYADPSQRQGMLERLKRDGHIEDVEVTARRKDGSTFPALLNVRALVDNGEPVCYDGAIQDVTDRKQAEDRYRTVFDTTGTATVIIEEDTSMSLVNREFVALTGYSESEVINTSWTRFVHKDDLERMKEYHRLRRVDPAKAPRNYEFRLINKQGEVRDCHLTTGMIPGTKKSVVSFVDITDRKRAEDARLESERRFRTLADRSPNMVFINTFGRVVYANEQCAAVMGYTQEELTAPDFDFMSLVAPDSRELIKQAFERHRRGGEVKPYEYALLTKDGRRIESIIATRLMEYEGKPAILGIVTDITRRKQTEVDLKAMAGTAMELVSLPARAEVFDYICERLPALVGDAVFAVNVYDAGTRTLTTRRVVGLSDEEAALISSAVGTEIRSVSLAHVPDEVVQRLMHVSLTEVAGKLYGVFLGQVPEQVCRRLEEQVGLSKAWSIGLRVGARLYGNITLLPRKYQPNARLIEAFAGQVSLALERRDAEQQQQESEARYRSLVELSLDGVSVHQDGKIALVNRAIADMLGFSDTAELVGRPVLDFVPPEDKADISKRMNGIMQQGRPAGLMEERFVRRDGSIIPVEVLAGPFQWNGRPAVQVMVRDISARKRAEKRMQESEESYRRLVELSPDGVAVHQDGRLVMVNPAGARTLGYAEPGELIGRTVLDIVHPDDRLRVIERIARTMKDGRAGEPNEELFARKDGSYVPVEVVNAPFYWRGRPAVLVMVRDISERKRAEAQLVESEQRYRQQVEASPDGVAVYENGVIVMANRACAAMLGYGDSLELLGRRAATIVHPDDLPAVQKAESGLGDTAAPQQPLRVRFVRRDGSILGTAVNGVTTTWQGRPAVQVTVRPDNTDRS